MIEFGNFSIHGDARPVDVEPDAWDAGRYERAVEANLRRLEQSRVGSIVLQHVIAPIVVVPNAYLRGFPNAYSGTVVEELEHYAPEDRNLSRTGAGALGTTIDFTPSHFGAPGWPDADPSDDLHPSAPTERSCTRPSIRSSPSGRRCASTSWGRRRMTSCRLRNTARCA